MENGDGLVSWSAGVASLYFVMDPHPSVPKSKRGKSSGIIGRLRLWVKLILSSPLKC